MVNYISVTDDVRHPLLKYPDFPIRARGYSYGDDMNRESTTPTGCWTMYTNAENGAGGATALSLTFCGRIMTTDVTAGNDQHDRVSGIRLERAYQSTITGMRFPAEDVTGTIRTYQPFSVDSAADGEAFIGIHSGVAQINALPTTARHLGVYWDISAGANYMLTSSNGTTQVTVDTTIPVDTAIHILRIDWTGEDAATLQLLTAAGATEGTGATVTAFNGTSANAHELTWFVQAEAGGAVVLTYYPWRVSWL